MCISTHIFYYNRPISTILTATTLYLFHTILPSLQMEVVCDVGLFPGGSKVLTIRSLLTFKNDTSVPLSVLLTMQDDKVGFTASLFREPTSTAENSLCFVDLIGSNIYLNRSIYTFH